MTVVLLKARPTAGKKSTDHGARATDHRLGGWHNGWAEGTMPWILDGNNLARGQGREQVRAAALALARHERVRIVLFFDGAPPPGSPQVERLGSIEVRYVPYADSAILAVVAGGGRGWKLATDDRSLALRARDSGTEVVAASSFWAKVARAAATPNSEVDPPRDGEGATAGERLPEAPSRIRRSPRQRRHW